jgi:hypothetical protein
MRTIKAIIKWYVYRRWARKNRVVEVPPRPCPPRDKQLDGFEEFTKNLEEWRLKKK